MAARTLLQRAVQSTPLRANAVASTSRCRYYATSAPPPSSAESAQQASAASPAPAPTPPPPPKEPRERSSESHGSSSPSLSNHPRDSLRFADNANASTAGTSSTANAAEDALSSTAPLTPPHETPLPPTSTEFGLVQSEPDPLKWGHSDPFPLPRVPFSTHRFVRQLEQNDVKRGMAIELMKATRELLLVHEDRARGTLLGRQDLENEAYLYTAALSELKTGSQVKSRNDGVALKSMTAVLQRETDSVTQKLKEDMQRLASDIQLDMNNRKEETSQEMKQLDISIMELNSKFTILLGEVRTEIESVKWISTRRVMTAIIAVVVSVIAYVSTASPSGKADKPPAPPSIEELGVRGGSSEEAELLGDPLAAGGLGVQTEGTGGATSGAGGSGAGAAAAAGGTSGGGSSGTTASWLWNGLNGLAGGSSTTSASASAAGKDKEE